MILDIIAQHDYQITVNKAATCTEDGECTYTCTKCNNIITKIEKAHHTWDNDIEVTKPTCTADGYTINSYV